MEEEQLRWNQSSELNSSQEFWTKNAEYKEFIKTSGQTLWNLWHLKKK